MNEAGIQKKTAWTAPGPNEPLFIAESPEMQEIKTLAARASGGDAKVLVTGESGVGKDVVACFIHARSNRSQRPFVAVNCAAFSETLLESELFGHVRGSFTGAHRDKIGKLQQAHKGTVFLDEVGEMSLPMQALLLRFLESGEIQPVGADGGGTKVDVRVISATNRDLPALIASGQFREDLMYRIRVIHLQVPPLRARREDIRPLIEFTIQRSGRPLKQSDEAMQALEQYRWPGNVRQLQNMIEQLSWMSAKDTVSLDDLPGALRTPAGTGILPARERRRQVADDLYHGLVTGVYSFWDHTYPLFMNRLPIANAETAQLGVWVTEHSNGNVSRQRGRRSLRLEIAKSRPARSRQPCSRVGTHHRALHVGAHMVHEVSDRRRVREQARRGQEGTTRGRSLATCCRLELVRSCRASGRWCRRLAAW